ncbi:MAG: alpha/beta hydrolase [Spirosomataceae bacterium]
MNELILDGAVLKIYYHHLDNQRPTLIFLHDSLGCIALWRDFPNQLGVLTQCNVLVYDRQGYGQSSPFGSDKRQQDYLEKEADVLQLILEKYHIQQAFLFGHSDGGSIALIAAAKYPTRIKGIMTEGAHIFVEEISLQGIRAAVEAYHKTNLKEKLHKYHRTNTDGVFWAWAETWLKPEFQSWNIEHFLPQITCPILVIQGEADEYGSLAQVQGIVRQVAGQAHAFIVPAAGHSPHKEAPAVVLERCVEFVQNL